MKSLKVMLLATWCVLGFVASDALAVDRPYTMGSVWTVTLVRIKPGMDNVYIGDLAQNWKRVMDEAKKQNLILSYKVLDSAPTSKDEWNMLLLVEFKNWGAFDTPPESMDAIAEKMVGPEKQQLESLVKRGEVREILGIRNMQEIVFK